MLNSSSADAPAGFDLVRRAGRGASAVVWQAVQQSTGRSVALKLLDADFSDASALRRFDRERTMMAALAGHPNVLTVYDAGVEDGRPWIATEYCSRGSLARHVATSGPLTSAVALAVLLKSAEALAAAHDQGVVHCDIKPANLMLTDFGEPAIGDFGLAQAVAGRTNTTTGYTLDYVAPELLAESKPTPAADVYSLGVTLWELLSGHAPFSGSEPVAPVVIMKRILDTPLPPLHGSVPSELVALLESMTAKAPGERPSMTEVAARAEEIGVAAGAPFAMVAPETQAPAEVPAPSPVAPTELVPAPVSAAPSDHGITQLRHRDAPVMPTREPVQLLRRKRRTAVLASLVVGSLTLAGATVFLMHTAMAATPEPSPPIAPAAVVAAPPTTAPPPTTTAAPVTTVQPAPARPYVRPQATHRRSAPAVGGAPVVDDNPKPTVKPTTTPQPDVEVAVPPSTKPKPTVVPTANDNGDNSDDTGSTCGLFGCARG